MTRMIAGYVSTGRYPSGRRVWLWLRSGRWWMHVEIGRNCLHLGSPPRRAPRLAPWQRSAS